MLSGVSDRVTTRGEAIGVYGLQRVASFACLLLYLGVVTGCAALGGLGSGPGVAKRVPGQEAAAAFFRDAELAYQRKDYALARGLYQSFLANYPQSPLVEDASVNPSDSSRYQQRHLRLRRP